MTSTLPVSDSRIPTDAMLVENPTLRLVFDCARCAWRDFGVTGLGDFYGLHKDRLIETGRELIRQPLIQAWRRRGYVAILVCHHDCQRDASGEDEPDDEVFAAVRQAAVELLPYGADFAEAAGLSDEYQRGEH